MTSAIQRIIRPYDYVFPYEESDTVDVVSPGVALTTNTGDGVFSAGPTNLAVKAQLITITMLEAGPTAAFSVVGDRPGQTAFANGVSASAYSSGGLTFTLTDGAAAYIAGDKFFFATGVGAELYIGTAGIVRLIPFVPFPGGALEEITLGAVAVGWTKIMARRVFTTTTTADNILFGFHKQ